MQVPARRKFAHFARSENSGPTNFSQRAKISSRRSSPLRRRQNHRAPPTVASTAAIALLFGRIDPSERPGAADFALRFAAPLVAVHTAQPRTAFRLFRTPIGRGYPTGIPLTHSRTPPPERRPVERGSIRAKEEEQARIAPVLMEMPAGAETYALPRDPLDFAKNDASEAGSGTLTSARRAVRCVRWPRAKRAQSTHSRRWLRNCLRSARPSRPSRRLRDRPLRLVARQRALVELFPERASRAEQK